MNKDIDDIFSDKMDENIKKEVRKNKRKTYVRIVIATTAISLLVVFCIIKYLIILDRNKFYDISNMNDQTDFVYMFDEPNIFVGEIKAERDGMFKYESSYKKYKQIGGKNIYLGEERGKNYSITLNGSINGEEDNFEEVFSDDISKRKSSMYGTRYLYFLYPNVDYGRNINDFRFLEEIDDNKVIEMVLCFDKQYSYDDVNKILDSNLINYYWVNTERELTMGEVKNRPVVNEREMIGIKTIDNYGKRIKNPVERFMNSAGQELEKNGQIDRNDLKIGGVVVVGSKSQLKELENNKIIKHSIIGTVVDKY